MHGSEDTIAWRKVAGNASKKSNGGVACWFLVLALAALVLSVYWLLLVGYPPPPRSFGIIGLGGNSSQVFEFKGLTAKVFENQ
jgi:hypothetical protein